MYPACNIAANRMHYMHVRFHLIDLLVINATPDINLTFAHLISGESVVDELLITLSTKVAVCDRCLLSTYNNSSMQTG